MSTLKTKNETITCAIKSNVITLQHQIKYERDMQKHHRVREAALTEALILAEVAHVKIADLLVNNTNK